MCRCLNQGFEFWLDIICIIYLSIVIFSFLFIDNSKLRTKIFHSELLPCFLIIFILILDVYVGSVGLIFTQVLTLVGRIRMGVRQATALVNQMVPVERILEYTRLPLENTLKSTSGKI